MRPPLTWPVSHNAAFTHRKMMLYHTSTRPAHTHRPRVAALVGPKSLSFQERPITLCCCPLLRGLQTLRAGPSVPPSLNAVLRQRAWNPTRGQGAGSSLSPLNITKAPKSGSRLLSYSLFTLQMSGESICWWTMKGRVSPERNFLESYFSHLNFLKNKGKERSVKTRNGVGFS